MAHSRGSGFRRAVSSRRQTSWELGAEGTLQLSAAGAAGFSLGGEALESGLTIVRTRGELTMGLSVATSVLDGFTRVAFGICIVSQNAFGIGITAVPTPIADEAWDGWFVYWTGSLFSLVATAALNNAEGPANKVISIDSKAMRKIKATDTILGVIEVENEVGTASLTAKLSTRTLVKLS